jgi:hypothetical protein
LDESLEDDVEDLLDRHDAAMTLGRFAPLMREARTKLLDAPERSIKGLEGKVRTLENAVVAYRQGLLADETLHAHCNGLNALRRTKNQDEVKLPEMSDLEKRSLAEGRIHIDGQSVGWAKEGEALLANAGVSFAAWQSVLERISQQQDPEPRWTGWLPRGFCAGSMRWEVRHERACGASRGAGTALARPNAHGGGSRGRGRIGAGNRRGGGLRPTVPARATSRGRLA